jgi:hypothetical protein
VRRFHTFDCGSRIFSAGVALGGAEAANCPRVRRPNVVTPAPRAPAARPRRGAARWLAADNLRAAARRNCIAAARNRVGRDAQRWDCHSRVALTSNRGLTRANCPFCVRSARACAHAVVARCGAGPIRARPPQTHAWLRFHRQDRPTLFSRASLRAPQILCHTAAQRQKRKEAASAASERRKRQARPAAQRVPPLLVLYCRPVRAHSPTSASRARTDPRAPRRAATQAVEAPAPRSPGRKGSASGGSASGGAPTESGGDSFASQQQQQAAAAQLQAAAAADGACGLAGLAAAARAAAAAPQQHAARHSQHVAPPPFAQQPQQQPQQQRNANMHIASFFALQTELLLFKVRFVCAPAVLHASAR